ncbi:MAG: ASKHA domain-containing protein [Verrucomicrobiales bacterium]|jgi:uncharacterized 2Fe-2S/4Fe-4S cluster protein (DUF4445 family)|nr:ASKHA domain-containing protein [Verrucomicrobiales bacterium]
MSQAITVSAGAGTELLAELLAARGHPLNTRCASRGLCHGCEVVLDGQTVRACQTRVSGSVTVSVPDRSRLEHRAQVSDSFNTDIPYAQAPLFEPIAGGRDTAFAVDLGTTTVAVLLVDLATGDVLARAGEFNAQIRFGDNVLTRIDAARTPAAIAALQAAAVTDTIAPLLRRACQRAGRGLERLAGGAIAGNTTMLHLLTGTDPTPLGVAPFTPRFLEARRVTAGALGLTVLAADVPVQLLPGIAAYIGADLTAGIHATGMIYDEQPSLLVDIGTNGEIILQSGGRLTGCATAAGPAFEGSGLRCGIRARAGAVGGIRLGLDPFRLELQIIGGGAADQAAGICGSAYVDFLAAAHGCGLLNDAGRLDPAAWARVPAELRLDADGEKALRLGANGKTFISEADIAVLLPAKAAIGAGIETLLTVTGTDPAAVSKLYLAGGFGLHLNVAHAIAIGLLPGFRPDQVRVVGNTALAGALLTVLDRSALAEMERLRAGVNVLELNLQEGFEDRFVDHLLLP